MTKLDGADEIANQLFDMVRDAVDDQEVTNAIAEKLREVARGNIDTKNWNL